MEHITTKEQAMTWLMRNKKKKEERLEAMKAIAIKNMKSAPGSKLIMSRHYEHRCLMINKRAPYHVNATDANNNIDFVTDYGVQYIVGFDKDDTSLSFVTYQFLSQMPII